MSMTKHSPELQELIQGITERETGQEIEAGIKRIDYDDTERP